MEQFKKLNTISICYNTILHCIVDFCCIYYMVQIVFPFCVENRIEQWLFYGILYNFIAFAGQLPVGIFGDYLQKDNVLITVSLFLLFVTYISALWVKLPVFIPVLLIGIGNACFHIGGGRTALQHRENTCGTVGIFVATGAFGVFGGRWLAGREKTWIPEIVVMLLIAFILHIILCQSYKSVRKEMTVFSISLSGNSWALLLAVCCIFVVVLRSFAGTVFTFPWSSGLMALLLTVAIVLGKAVGGILADRFGISKTVFFSLTLSALLFLGANSIPLMGLMAVFLFNMTMPITLSLLAMQFPYAKGMMFGLLTFAIFIGLIPSYFCSINQFSKPWIYVLLSVASLLLLYIPLLLEKRRKFV
ncbi:MAG: hypothetical protein IJZ64_02300 [Ruminococcus sp.]|nr:hypothetical protein [Ruminococcus sp.]